MNYLAHALLSPDDPMVLMGNLWGDLIKPRDYDLLEPGLLTGIQHHRKIDAFTDEHPAVVEIIRLLRPYQGKYTPVVVDVLMDYMLSAYWERYHPQSLERFCQVKYEQVSTHLEFIPERLHQRITRMLSHQWLESCKNRERMENTLLMLSRRAAFENRIPEALVPYDLYQSSMDEYFLQFFDEVRQHVSLQNAG